MSDLKKAYSSRTGRTAQLPPAIYNNPIRMRSGGWEILDDMGNVTTPPVEPIKEPVDKSKWPDHIKRALGIMDEEPPAAVTDNVIPETEAPADPDQELNPIKRKTGRKPRSK